MGAKSTLLSLFRLHARSCSDTDLPWYDKRATADNPSALFAIKSKIGVIPEQARREKACDVLERLVKRERAKRKVPQAVR